METKSPLQRLSFKIAEEVADLFTDRSMQADDVSTEDIYNAVYVTMPTDMQHVAAEHEAFTASISGPIQEPTGPSLIQRLREAVHADKGSPLKVVLEAAIELTRERTSGT